MYEAQAVFFTLTSVQHMHKYLKDLDQCERSEIKMAALGCDDERLDPSTRVLTVLARIHERGCLNQTNQTLP